MSLLLQVFFFIFLEQKNKKKQMNYLIQCCDAIIEQKDFSIIDGESKESLLSNKLFLLNKRYHQSLKAIKKRTAKTKGLYRRYLSSIKNTNYFYPYTNRAFT